MTPNFSIAAAFGNVHGVYKPGNVKLNPSILATHQASSLYLFHDNKAGTSNLSLTTPHPSRLTPYTSTALQNWRVSPGRSSTAFPPLFCTIEGEPGVCTNLLLKW